MTALPYYDEALDFKALWQEFPPPDRFVGGADRPEPAALRQMQERRFLQQIERGWQIPFYQRRWTEAGLAPGDIRSLGDLESIPPFTVADLKDSIERMPPFGDIMGHRPGVDAPLPLVMQTSSGTTGMPRPMLFAPRDREVMNIMRARCMYWHGLRPGELVQSMHALGLTNAGMSVRETVWKYLGAIPVMTGAGTSTPTRRQIELLQAWKSSMLVGFPAYIRHMGQVAINEVGLDPRSLGVRSISTHLGTEDRSVLEDLWAARVYDTYGSSEVGVVASECPEQSGMHIFEDAHMVEIVDPDNGHQVEDGAKGAITITSLFKHLAPMIRFNVNDISAIAAGPCPCGCSFRRLAGIMGRGDNMIKLRGVNIYPEAVGSVVQAAIPTTGEFICIVTTNGDHDEMLVKAEAAVAGDVNKALEDVLASRLKEALSVRLDVEIVSPGTLHELTGVTSNAGKPRRLIDRRSA